MVRPEPQVTYNERTECLQCGSNNLITTKEPGSGIEGEKSCLDCFELYQTWDICIIPEGYQWARSFHKKICNKRGEPVKRICAWSGCSKEFEVADNQFKRECCNRTCSRMLGMSRQKNKFNLRTLDR